MDKKLLLKEAGELFMKKEYKKALERYIKVLQNDPTNQEAQLGTILCDLVQEDEEEASALFDFYIILKEENEPHPEEKVIEMVKDLDKTYEQIEEAFSDFANLFYEGISYNDFKLVMESRGGFKRAFEDIMFSTKVVITKKSDFFDFIELLLENGFYDMVYSYLEDAIRLYPSDRKVQEFAKKLGKV